MNDDHSATGFHQSRWRIGTAIGLATLAFLSTIVVLLGWAFDNSQLRSFGREDFPNWPLAATGYSFLALAVIAHALRRPKLAAALLAGPGLVALGTLAELLSGGRISVGTLLFADDVSRFNFTRPGLISLNTAVAYATLSIAMLARYSRWPLLRETGPIIAIMPLALSGMAMMTLAVTPTLSDERLPAHISIPAAVATALIAVALLILRPPLDELHDLRMPRPRAVRIGIAAALLAPAIPAVFELVVVRESLETNARSEMIIALFNVVMMAVVAFWAVTRVGRERVARAELNTALNGATVVLTDAAGRIIHWSLGCQQLYGWTADEAIGENKYMLLRARCPDWRSSYALPDADGAIELVEVDKKGREIHVIERLLEAQGANGLPITVHSITDISERVAALKALRASEERLAQATAAHELGVFDWDVTTGNVDWSPGTEQRIGLPLGAMSTFESWRHYINPADFQSMVATFTNTVADHAERFGFRYHLANCKSAGRAIEGSARAFYDSEGNLVRAVGAVLDITERDDREAELRRREAQLRSVLETVPDAMVVFGEDGRILQFSATAEALWGYRAADVVGQGFNMLMPQDDRDASNEMLRRLLNPGEWLIGQVLMGNAEAANGRRFPIEVRAGAARSDGHLLLTVFIRDLTERVATEQRLSDLNAEMAHVSRQNAMSEMAADLAHELNQPLSATSNFLAAARMLIERGETGERVIDLLRLGAEQTQRAGEIIRRLRAFVARGEVEMRVEPVERTVREAVELVLVGTGHLNLRVIFNLDPTAPFVLADRIQVQQVLVNLLRNALQALKLVNVDDRQITISSERLPDSMIAIVVTDSGPGIPADIIEKLFSRFSTTKGGAEGMGIGLSVSKRIIEAHGGVLSASNHPEGGASFRFTLPAVEGGEE
ncbi:PAS domain S-box protein [Sphingomonas sp. RS6]